MPKYLATMSSTVFDCMLRMGSTVGWVNLYQKFEIEKYTVCGKLILQKKWKGI